MLKIPDVVSLSPCTLKTLEKVHKIIWVLKELSRAVPSDMVATDHMGLLSFQNVASLN